MSEGSIRPKHTKTEQQGSRIKSFRLTNQSLKSFSLIGGSMYGEELVKELLPSVSYQQQSMKEALLWCGGLLPIA